MTVKRTVAVFSAGCLLCDDAVKLVQRLAGPSCRVDVLNMHDSDVAEWAKILGIRSVPAVVINGKLLECCAGRGIDETVLRAEGLGRPN